MWKLRNKTGGWNLKQNKENIVNHPQKESRLANYSQCSNSVPSTTNGIPHLRTKTSTNERTVKQLQSCAFDQLNSEAILEKSQEIHNRFKTRSYWSWIFTL